MTTEKQPEIYKVRNTEQDQTDHGYHKTSLERNNERMAHNEQQKQPNQSQYEEMTNSQEDKQAPEEVYKNKKRRNKRRVL